ncbi:MAG: Universal stress protein family protein [Neobacillus sp.]|jgi:nucleotide-binding universal stress UspA family protein|nr:Universal stress protein family protein [Neobacillus sp.]
MKERILVAIDGSDNSLQALAEAVKLAEAIPSKLYLVNVQPSFHTIHTRLFIGENMIREYQTELFDKAAEPAVKYLEDRDVEYVVLMKVGDPVYQIAQLAEDLKAMYIVMGSRGMGLIRGTVLGSVSSGVLHETDIPMVIIPQKDK